MGDLCEIWTSTPITVASTTTRNIATITTTIQITAMPSTVLTMMECHTVQGAVHTQCLISVGDRSQLPQKYFFKNL